MPLSTPEQATLVTLLASVEALWLPHRFSLRDNAVAAAAIHERRCQYPTHGVPYTVGGTSAAKMAEERLLRRLQAAGLIRLYYKGKRSGVALTAAGDALARCLAPTNRIDESWHWLERVATVEAEFGGRSNAGFMLEHDVLGIADSTDTKPFTDLEDFALPLLVNDLLQSASDAVGRIGYRVTSNGKAALPAGKPSPPDDAPEYDPNVGQVFIDAFQAAVDLRDAWQPAKPGHVWIPLGAGSWPAKAGA